MEFGEQLAAQWTVQAQEQQQQLAEKVLAAQAESVEKYRGEVASVKIEFDQELDRMGKVTREVEFGDFIRSCSQRWQEG